MPVKIEVSDSNYRKLMGVKEETGYRAIDEVLEDVLDFWFTFREFNKGLVDDGSCR